MRSAKRVVRHRLSSQLREPASGGAKANSVANLDNALADEAVPKIPRRNPVVLLNALLGLWKQRKDSTSSVLENERNPSQNQGDTRAGKAPSE